jgi:hypothetical protein
MRRQKSSRIKSSIADDKPSQLDMAPNLDRCRKKTKCVCYRRSPRILMLVACITLIKSLHRTLWTDGKAGAYLTESRRERSYSGSPRGRPHGNGGPTSDRRNSSSVSDGPRHDGKQYNRSPSYDSRSPPPRRANPSDWISACSPEESM